MLWIPLQNFIQVYGKAKVSYILYFSWEKWLNVNVFSRERENAAKLLNIFMFSGIFYQQGLR